MFRDLCRYKMTMQIIKKFPFQSPSGTFTERRYTIFQRDDGHYSIGEEYFYRTFNDDGTLLIEGWSRDLRGGSIFGDVTLAEQEIQSRLAHLD
jgi:hypothetical protein